MYKNKNLESNNDNQNTNLTPNNIKKNNLIDPIIKSALEYYDQYQPKIQKILDKLEYIEIINNGNVTDQFIFYDGDNNIILKSKFEVLSIYIPQNNVWKWSWSLPTASAKNTFISRKILDYAFTLTSNNDYMLKSTLINSKITITNTNQLDIYIALSAMLSKTPFIFKIYLIPLKINESSENQKRNNDKKGNFYYYKKIINNEERHNYISLYSLIIDWNP